METIEWQHTTFLMGDQDDFPQGPDPDDTEMMMEEKEDGQAIQLRKFEDPSKNEARCSYTALLAKFEALLSNGEICKIAQELLTEDFEVFIFSSTERVVSLHGKCPKGFIDVYKTIQIKERRVRETNIDLEKQTACQICSYKIIYDGEAVCRDEISFEVFSIMDGKISKYRVSFGNPFLDELYEDPLEQTRKDKMLARVKQINYALAGQPDLEKVASLLDENTQYKICRWNDFKCFTLCKTEFSALFERLEENMSVKCIVPYEISADNEGKYIAATYVYHLEDNCSGEKFEGLSTCTYEFDRNINITVIHQQGELYPKGEIDIPFEIHSRNRLEKKFEDFHSVDVMPFDCLYNENILFDCSFWTICSLCKPQFYYFHGLKQVDVLAKKMELCKGLKLHFNAPVDIYVDHQNESYDVVFGLLYLKVEGLQHYYNDGKDELTDFVCFVRQAFENGKLTKSLKFTSGLPFPIESPYDDKTFQGSYLK